VAGRIAGKLGKTAAVKPHGLSELAFYAQGKLLDPPPSVAVPDVPSWNMMDNDRLGCCVISGVGHLIMAANADVGKADPVPDDAHIQEQYFAITGGQDAGCNELDVLKLWYGRGLFDPRNKIAAFAPVRESNPLDVHASVAYFGACFIGVSLPGSAQQQFANGEPWTITPQDQIEGGHCVVIVGYDPQYLYAVTWGAITAITYPWMSRYCDEAWAVIPQSFVEAGKGPLFDLKSLQADIGNLR
jgi:hypothetical protein